VAQAHIFVQVGAGLDGWTQPLLSAAQRSLRVVTLADGVELLRAGDAHGGSIAGTRTSGSTRSWCAITSCPPWRGR